MKKCSVIFVTLILCLALAVSGAFAASGSASLTGPSTVRAGDTITLSFKVSGSGLFGASGALSYDSSKLTLTGTTQKIGSPWVVEFNGNNFVAYDNNLSSPINSSATLFTATFKVSSSLAPGTAIKVSCSSVTLSDGSADINVGTVSYSTTLAEPMSGVNALESLTVSNATIAPVFSPDVTYYTASVPYEVSKLDLGAVAKDSKAKVSVNNPSLTVAGTTNVTVTVTAENGASKTYTIAVTRAQDPNYVPSGNNDLSGITVEGFLLSPVFDPELTEYVIWLPYEVTGVSVSGTAADSKATVKVEGGDELTAGEDNEIRVICKAENGQEQVYTVVAKRAAPHTPEDAEPQPIDTAPIDTDTEPEPTETAPETPPADTAPQTPPPPEEPVDEPADGISGWLLIPAFAVGLAAGGIVMFFAGQKGKRTK